MAQAPWPACPVQREQDSARLGYQGRRRICDRSDYAGTYVWSVDSASTFAAIPEWLLERAAPAPAPKPDGYFAEIAGGVHDGRRNASLASLCGKLFRVGLTPSQVLDYLTYWNTLNTPPLPEERIKLAVKNIWKLEARRFGS